MFDLVNDTKLHFLILRSSKLLRHQSEMESISCWSNWLSDGSQIFLRSLRSSANKRQLEYFITDGKSLINMLNKTGLPCGTPDVTLNKSDIVLWKRTYCERPTRKEQNYNSKLALIPKLSSLSNKMEWLTLSKAFEKSV